MNVKGLHHVTAITGEIQRNLDFYTGLLALRLAKRTVIQEEPTTYHLFYGDAVGTVGTGFTFFDWPRVGHDRIGARNVVRTLFAVQDEAALAWWGERFERSGVAYTLQQDHAGRQSLHFSDAEGQRLGLVAAGPFAGYTHWHKHVAPPEAAIQALHSVTLGVREVEPTVRFLRDVFGYAVAKTFRSGAENEGEAVALTLDGGGIGRELVAVERTDAQPGLRGIGSVHHIALTIALEDAIEQWHERIVATGLKVGPIIRRYYFDSIYVRIPGGILFELATEGPGLAIDDNLETLGERLTLPPFLEDQRAEIEAKLKPIVVPKPRDI
ncbi:MAG: VOC family protein [Caldilineaceae bacterium]|nr:VOC family protein [Caldilineaceae bacterium]